MTRRTNRPRCTGHTPNGPCKRAAKPGFGTCVSHGPTDTPLCVGTTKRGPCQNNPIRGATVCRTHGGAIGRVKAAAGRRYAEQQIDERVRGTLAKLLDTGAMIEDPLTELSKLATEAVLWKDIMAQQVAELGEYRYEDGRGAEQLRSEIALFERALDRCNSILVGIAKLGIDERLAAIQEKQVERILAAIDAALRFVNVTADQLEPAREVAARHLRSTA